MNAVASGQLTNLLENATWLDGYFGSGGSIQTADTGKQKYTDNYIEVEPEHNYLVVCSTSTAVTKWTRTVLYDTTKTYKTMETVNNSEQRTDFYLGTIITTNVTAYIRFSVRTYGNIDVALIDMDEVEQWLESNITFENVTAT